LRQLGTPLGTPAIAVEDLRFGLGFGFGAVIACPVLAGAGAAAGFASAGLAAGFAFLAGLLAF
jgi:hypothetical protein